MSPISLSNLGCGEAQHPIAAKWNSGRERHLFRSAVAGDARVGGCQGSQYPILAFDREYDSAAGCVA